MSHKKGATMEPMGRVDRVCGLEPLSGPLLVPPAASSGTVADRAFGCPSRH